MFEDIKKVVYINLERRLDRKEQVEAELQKYFPSEKIQRFNAIQHKLGYIGCTKSHIAVLEMAIRENWNNVLIVEDDAIWSNFDKMYHVYENLIKNPYDVITFGTAFATYDKNTYKLLEGQTTTAYLVNKHYYTTLLKNFQEGLHNLLVTRNKRKYSVDQYWKLLQKKDNWFCIVPSLLIQGPSYSDIERKTVDYTRFFV
jgi:glycosyl transferase family 25